MTVKNVRTITLPPSSWDYSVEIFIAATEDGTAARKDAAKEEIRRMARILDDMNERETPNTGDAA